MTNSQADAPRTPGPDVNNNAEGIFHFSEIDLNETKQDKKDIDEDIPRVTFHTIINITIPSVTNSIKNNETPTFVVTVNGNENPQNPTEASSDAKSQEILAKWKRYIGLLLAVLSALMFSINSLIFKMLDYKPPLIPAFYMFVWTTVFTLPAFLIHKSNKESSKTSLSQMDWKKIALLILRSFTGCSGMIFFFYSLNYLNVGDALVIACSSPVFVFILAFLFLGESCGAIPILTVIMTLVGVGIITRPPLLTGAEEFQYDDLIGAGLALGSMLCIASTIVLMRFLQDIHHSLINLVFGGWGTLQTVTLAVILGVLELPATISDAVVMGTTGLVFFIAQTFLALALQYEQAGPVSLLRTSEVVFAFIWQLLFLHVVPDIFSIAGACLIMLGIFTTILRKWIGSLPAEHRIRNNCGFLLR